MLSFSWPAPLRILCLGSHSDDIEIGCGGTLLTLRDQQVDHVTWVVFSGTGDRESEAKRSAARLSPAPHDIDVLDFKDGYFPFHAERIKDYFEELKGRVNPNLIFTHCLRERHQDHRTIAELTWNTFRDHLILEYEVPKFEGDLEQTNVYVPLARDVVEEKVALLMSGFESQKSRRWFSEETFRGLMRLRGIESNADHAEGFICRKVLVSQ
jgi:LmbE family N-acetylglucosaminyl deacetylase